MANILVTCTLEGSSGLTDDSAVSTFAFDSSLGTRSDLSADAFDAIARFWNDATGPSGISLASYLSPAISRAANSAILRAYDVSAVLAGGAMGSPFDEAAFTPDAVFGASKALPSEVAAVLTLRGDGFATAPVEVADGADPGSAPDRPKSRHTGRIFIGPLTVNAQVEEAVTLRSRPSPNFINTVGNAAQKLAVDLGAGHDWCVWSRKDGLMREITQVEIDNAWDTMRSRGNAPTARTSFAL